MRNKFFQKLFFIVAIYQTIIPREEREDREEREECCSSIVHGLHGILAIFWNEITTILTSSTSKGVGGGGHVFCFGGP